jgi:hypothetical protein
MVEVAGVIILFWGLFIALITWAAGGHAETPNEKESDAPWL